MKVLIADDDSLFCQMLGGMLAAHGYETITASSGLEVWEILEREHLRMLVVDWMMPGIDGPALIRRIRSAGWPGYTYIILLTAMSAREDIVEGLRVGADDYVTKPFRHEELLARMGVGARIVKLQTGLSESLAREEERSGLDSLTGLPNRRALYARAHAEMSRAERQKTSVGVVMMDIDHFKRINDRLGHAGGTAPSASSPICSGRASATTTSRGAGAARSSSSSFRAHPWTTQLQSQSGSERR
jgi:two-component system chemotaxis response regulator CheY